MTSTAHPYAHEPLSAFQSITAVCNDCGHTTVLDRDQLSAMTAVTSFGLLWQHAYCPQCRAAGAPANNLVLQGVPQKRSVGSDAAVRVGSNRSDPYVGLPRRRMFDEPS